MDCFVIDGAIVCYDGAMAQSRRLHVDRIDHNHVYRNSYAGD